MDTIWLPDLAAYEGPKYKRLVAALRDGITAGALSPGDRLPPVRDLAWRLKITPGTVARAYAILTDDGVLEAAVGRGTFVADRGAAPEPEPEPITAVLPSGPASLQQRDDYEVNMVSPTLGEGGQIGLIQRLLTELAMGDPAFLTRYPGPKTMEPALRAARHWMRGTPLGPVGPRDTALSHGGQNGILMALVTIQQRFGMRPVIIEALSYVGFRRAADLTGAQILPVDLDAQGIDPDALEALGAAHPGAVLLTSPEIHNPTCRTTPTLRREEIARIAARHDLHVIEDDCYFMGSHREPTYRMLLPERAWYVTSISKSLTPALRLGMVVAPQGQGRALETALAHSCFGLATPLTALAERMLTHPDLAACEDRVRAITNRYLRVAANVLGRYEIFWRDSVPFFWLRLPPGWRASAFCRAAEEQGVRIRAAEEFAPRDVAAPQAVRIAVNGAVTEAAYEAALLRLSALLEHPPGEIGV